MKTPSSQRLLLIISLSALLGSPAFAAFGDNTAPADNALPPGTYPSSQSDSDKKADSHADSHANPTDKQPAEPDDTHKDAKPVPHSGS